MRSRAIPARRAAAAAGWDLAALCCFVLLLPYAAGAIAGGLPQAGHVAEPAGYSPLRWHDVRAVGMTRYGGEGGSGGEGADRAPTPHRPLPRLLPVAHAQGPDAAPQPGQLLDAVLVGEFGYAGGEFGRFDGPRAVASDPDGRIIVADTDNHRIVVMDRNGVHLRTIGEYGEAAGQFISPSGVASDGSGRIMVADNGNGRIQVFDRDFSFEFEFGRAANGTSEFGFVTGISAGADGSMAVSDTRGIVHVFGPDGSRKARIAGFSHQFDAAIGPEGEVAVFDSRRGAVSFYWQDGRETGRSPIAAAHGLSNPTIDMDLYGRIILGGFPGSIAIYGADGAPIGSPFNPLGKIAWISLAADPLGRVLAADWRGNVVHVLGALLIESYQMGKSRGGGESLPGSLYGVAVDLQGNAIVPSAEPGGVGGTVHRLELAAGLHPVGEPLAYDHLAAPRGVGVGPDGEIIVADGGDPDREGRPAGQNQDDAALLGPGVVIFDAEGAASKVVSYGGGPGGGSSSSREFEDPAGVAVYTDAGGSGRIAVADNVAAAAPRGGGGGQDGGKAGRIVVLNMTGGLVMSFGGMVLQSAAGVAVDGGTGDIVVADPENGTVRVFSAAGRLLRTLDPGADALPSPTGVAVDRYGQIAVSSAGESNALALIDGVSGAVRARAELVARAGGGQDAAERGLAGVAVAPGGDFLVVDRTDGIVRVVSTSLASAIELASAGVDDVSFRAPAGVAVDPADGRILVADAGNDRVQLFDASARHVLTFGSAGSGPLHMRSPMGAAFGPGGIVVVADTGNDRVMVYDRLGGHAVPIGAAPGAPGPDEFDSPESVAVDPADGRIVVADTGNDRVVVLNADHTHNHTIAEAKGEPLRGPAGVAAGADGRIRIADTGSGRIIDYNPADGMAVVVDARAAGLPSPRGVAVAPADGRAYVTDPTSPAVHAVDGDRLSRAFGADAAGSALDRPAGLAVDPATGRILVAEAGGNRVVALDGTSGGRAFALALPARFGGFEARLMDVAVDPYGAGRILVAEAEYARIRVLDTEGNVLFARGTAGTGNSSFSRPSGIASVPNGSSPSLIAVADSGNNRVQVLDHSGDYVCTAGRGMLRSPTAVASLPDGRLVVADSGNGRAMLFNGTDCSPIALPDGRGRLGGYLEGQGYGFPIDMAVGAGEGGPILLVEPQRVYVYDPADYRLEATINTLPPDRGLALPYMRDAAMDEDGRLFVADALRHRIDVFSDAGGPYAHAGTIGRHGTADGELFRVSGIDYHAGRIVVGDTLGPRVQAFSTMRMSGGADILVGGPGGIGGGARGGPAGVATDSAGRVVVADMANHRVLIFDPYTGNTTTIGGRGSANGMFDEPVGVAVDSRDRIVVADHQNSRVQVFDRSGSHVQSIVHNGTRFPQDVAVDSLDRIIVPSATDRMVHRFTPDGAHIGSIGRLGSPVAVSADDAGRIVAVKLDFYATSPIRYRVVVYNGTSDQATEFVAKEGTVLTYRPMGIDIDSHGRILVADNFNNTVRVHRAADGALLHEFGSQGSGTGQFRVPTDVHVAADGRIYVADHDNGRVQVFGADGEHASTFSMSDADGGRFSMPRGIAADPDRGRLAVADTGNHRVQAFGLNGTHEDTFGARGTANANFAFESGIAFDADGNIYVADTGNHRVKIFNPRGAHLQTIGGPGPGMGDGMLRSPRAVDVDRLSGRIVVADTGNDRVQVFAPAERAGVPGGLATNGHGVRASEAPHPDYILAGSLRSSPAAGAAGSSGGGGGGAPVPLSGPSGVAVDGAGRIVVSDTGNNRTVVFNADLSYNSTIGAGAGLGPPLGVDAGASGRIAVADPSNGRVAVFSPGGTLLGSIGAVGAAGNGGPPPMPQDAASYGSAGLAVLDAGTNTVRLYEIKFATLSADSPRPTDSATALFGYVAAAADGPELRDGIAAASSAIARDSPRPADSAASPASLIRGGNGDAPPAADGASLAVHGMPRDSPRPADAYAASYTAIARDSPRPADSAASPASLLLNDLGDRPAVADGALLAVHRAASDSPSASDSHAAGYSILAGDDASGAADAYAASSTMIVRAAPPSVSDGAHAPAAYIVAPGPDAPAVRDAAAPAAGLEARDAPRAADAYAANLSIAAGDAGIAPLDSAVASGGTGTGDAAQPADRARALASFLSRPQPADAPAVADNASARIMAVLTHSDRPGVKDGADARAARSAGDPSDAPAVSDGAAALSASVVARSDAPAVSDGAAALSASVVARSDAPAVSDSAVARAMLSASPGDAPAVSDSAVARAMLSASPGDAPAVSDSAVARAMLSASPGDAPAVSDSAVALTSGAVSPGDAPAVSDSAVALTSGAVSPGDAPAVSDMASASGMFVLAARDSAAVSDRVAFGGSYAVSAGDAPVHLFSILLAVDSPAIVPNEPGDNDTSAPEAAQSQEGAADAPSLSDFVLYRASHVLGAADAPDAIDSAFLGLADYPASADAPPVLHEESIGDAPSLSDSAEQELGAPPVVVPPPAVVVPPPAPPAPPAVVVPPPAPPAPPPPAPVVVGGGGAGGGGGGGGGGSAGGHSDAHRGGGLRLPSIVEATWDVCGGRDDLFVVVDYSRHMTYVAVEPWPGPGRAGDRLRGAATGGEGDGAAAHVPAGVSFAVPSGTAGIDYTMTWHASVDVSAWRDLRIEARMASGVPPPAYLSSSSLGECEADAPQGSRCYSVADEERLLIDSCRGTHVFGAALPLPPDATELAAGAAAPAPAGPRQGSAGRGADRPEPGALAEREPDPFNALFGTEAAPFNALFEPEPAPPPHPPVPGPLRGPIGGEGQGQAAPAAARAGDEPFQQPPPAPNPAAATAATASVLVAATAAVAAVVAAVLIGRRRRRRRRPGRRAASPLR